MISNLNQNDEVKCPCCRSEYQIRDAYPAFREQLNQIYVVYALCPDCRIQFIDASVAGKKDITISCFANIKTKNADQSGELYPWAFTTEIALHTNAYDLTLALENGQRVPRELYDLIEYGELDIRCLPIDLYGRALNEY